MSQVSSRQVRGDAEDTKDSGDAEEDEVQKVLEALADPACRVILQEVSETPRSAGELSEVCGLPQSTTYRKLDELSEADLVEERTRLGRNGNHSSEYVSNVDAVEVEVSDDGLLGVELSLSEDDSTPIHG